MEYLVIVCRTEKKNHELFNAFVGGPMIDWNNEPAPRMMMNRACHRMFDYVTRYFKDNKIVCLMIGGIDFEYS